MQEQELTPEEIAILKQKEYILSVRKRQHDLLSKIRSEMSRLALRGGKVVGAKGEREKFTPQSLQIEQGRVAMAQKSADEKLKKLTIESGHVELVPRDTKFWKLKKLDVRHGKVVLVGRRKARKPIAKAGKTIYDCDQLQIFKRSEGKLGDHLVCCISVRDLIKNIGPFAELPKEAFYSIDIMGVKMMDLIMLLFRIAYHRVFTHMIRKIREYVPKDIGTLQASMRYSICPLYSIIAPDRPSDPIITIFLFANQEYAKIVNRMPIQGSPHVRHFGIQKSSRTGRPLYDPKAQQNFYNFILLIGRNMAIAAFKKVIDQLTFILKSKYSTGINRLRVKNIFIIKPEQVRRRVM